MRRVALVFAALWVMGTLLGALLTPPANTSHTVECDDRYETCDF